MLFLGMKTKASHIMLKDNKNLFWRSCKEKDNSILPFTSQRGVQNCTHEVKIKQDYGYDCSKFKIIYVACHGCPTVHSFNMIKHHSSILYALLGPCQTSGRLDNRPG